MAQVDYWAIEQEIAEIIRANLPGVTVAVEEEMMFSKEQTPWMVVYLDARETPRERQKLSAGLRTFMRLQFTIWVWCFSLEMKEAIRMRDDWLGQLEVLLMRNRTINDMVDSSWIEGGRLPSARIQGRYENRNEGNGFVSGAEVKLVAEVTAVAD